jgi:hypothetical protein
MNPGSPRRWVVVLGIWALAGGAVPGVAQQQGNSEISSSLEEVVVTATKRASTRRIRKGFPPRRS